LATLHTSGFWSSCCCVYRICDHYQAIFERHQFKSLAATARNAHPHHRRATVLSRGCPLPGSSLVLNTVLTLKLIVWLSSVTSVATAIMLGRCLLRLFACDRDCQWLLVINSVFLHSSPPGTMGATLGFAALPAKEHTYRSSEGVMHFINTEIFACPDAYIALLLVIWLRSSQIHSLRSSYHCGRLQYGDRQARRIRVEFTQILVTP